MVSQVWLHSSSIKTLSMSLLKTCSVWQFPDALNSALVIAIPMYQTWQWKSVFDMMSDCQQQAGITIENHMKPSLNLYEKDRRAPSSSQKKRAMKICEEWTWWAHGTWLVMMTMTDEMMTTYPIITTMVVMMMDGGDCSPSPQHDFWPFFLPLWTQSQQRAIVTRRWLAKRLSVVVRPSGVPPKHTKFRGQMEFWEDFLCLLKTTRNQIGIGSCMHLVYLFPRPFNITIVTWKFNLGNFHQN